MRLTTVLCCSMLSVACTGRAVPNGLGPADAAPGSEPARGDAVLWPEGGAADAWREPDTRVKWDSGEPPPRVLLDEDFDRRSYSGWTVTRGSWSAEPGYLEGTSGHSEVQLDHPVAVDLEAGTLRMEVALPMLDCRGAMLTLRDADGQGILSFGIDYCVPWGGASRVVLSVDGYGVWNEPWSPDRAWHEVAVRFSNGAYDLYYDGELVQRGSGPARLRASSVSLGGWQHTNPGTRYDNIYIGP